MTAYRDSWETLAHRDLTLANRLATNCPSDTGAVEAAPVDCPPDTAHREIVSQAHKDYYSQSTPLYGKRIVRKCK